MLKRKTNGAWSNISTLKKKVNGVWDDCSFAKKKVSGVWSIVWEKKLIALTANGALNSYNSVNISSVANGNIRIYMKKKNEFGNDLKVNTYIAKADGSLFEQGETLYIEYTFNTDGGVGCFVRFYSGATHIWDIGLPESGTRTATITRAASNLRFEVWNNNYEANDFYCEFLIKKIYSDKTIYYWNTETIYNK